MAASLVGARGVVLVVVVLLLGVLLLLRCRCRSSCCARDALSRRPQALRQRASLQQLVDDQARPASGCQANAAAERPHTTSIGQWGSALRNAFP